MPGERESRLESVLLGETLNQLLDCWLEVSAKPVSSQELTACGRSLLPILCNARIEVGSVRSPHKGDLMQLTIPIPESRRTLRLPPGAVDWTEGEFFRFCESNRELRIERSAKGEITVMSPAGGYSGFQNAKVVSQLDVWATKDGSGIAFDSSTGFRLPNGAMRSPDAAWVRLSRLRELSHREKQQFIPLCPDFVIELASPSDDIGALREKMEEYRAAGLRLGWLILPELKQVQIYTPTQVEALTSPEALSGDPVLPGFRLELAIIWNPPF